MLYIAIGRNVGEVPMPLDVWEDFQGDVIEVFYAEFYVDPDTVAHGKSRYGSMREETCVMVWFEVGSVALSTIERLSEVAVKYGQESIAWTISETMFAEGAK